jgi:hypothetical protein
VPFISTEILEHIARDVLRRFNNLYLLFEPQPVPIEQIIENVFGLTIEYMRLTVAGCELGRLVYDDGYSTRFNADTDKYELVRVTAGTMLIEALLLEAQSCYGRFRFTLAHELAHWILHKDLFTGTKLAASFTMDMPTKSRVEWQANYLAKAILMPSGQLKRAFYSVACNDESKIFHLSKMFEVSKQAMQIRLKELSLIQN